MFTTAITLAGDASSSQVYDLQSITGSKSIRGDVALGAALPRLMTISHSVAGKGTQISDRHLVRLDLVKADAVTGETVNGSTYIVLDMPRKTFTVAQLQDQVTQLKNFLTAGNVAKLLNNEP